MTSTQHLSTFLTRTTSTPYALSLTLGLGTASYYFWGNLASQYMGAISIPIRPEQRKKLGIEVGKAVEIWGWAYALGAKHMGISGAVAGLSVMAAALQLPARHLSSTKTYLLGLSALLLSNGIYTVAVMLPTNNRILAIRDKIVQARSASDSTSSESPLTAAQEEEVESLLQKWKNMHYVRLALGTAGWVGTLAAYVTTI